MASAADKQHMLYEEALSTGSACADEERWEEAISAFQSALEQFPDDPEALTGLAGALAGAGRRREAAQAYLKAAEQLSEQQSSDLAVERWKDAAQVDPESVPAHANLLRAYLAQGRTSEAMQEYVSLANIYRAQGQIQHALEISRYALKVDPHHAEILALAHELEGEEQTEPIVPGTGPLDFPLEFETEQDEGGSPVETARQKALADLAEAVFDDTPPQTGPLVMRPLSKREVDTLISTGLDRQTAGDVEGAVRCYKRVLQAGVIQPAVNFNLGLLYEQQLRFEDAIAQLQQSVKEAEYRLGSHFALGECYRALGHIDEALAHFIEVLKIVDMGTVQREQADDLFQLYEELARTHAAKGEREQAEEFVNALISFLSERGWEDKVTQARELLDALSREGPTLSLAEVLAIPGSERILQSISLAQEYQRRGLGYAALEELSRAIVLNPTFLPLHQQMGETLAGLAKVDRAVAKFLAVADVYRVRGNFSHAIALYERALRLAPMDPVVRAKLIDLLVSHGKIDRALEHYMALGDAYYQMAQLERARERYNEALQLAPRGSADHNWAVRILHRIGDIDLQRVDWRHAVAVYEQIRNLAPDDEKARLTLMDLYNRFNQQERAIGELDSLLELYRQAGKMQKVTAVLQEQVQEQPDNIPLRARLAQAYLDARNVKEALQQLDVLGDLQLQAGSTKDAIATINAILRLNPPNAEAYQQLLEQLTAG